jgi:hypothetical protein
LFKKRKPLSEMTPEERAERKIELMETISRAMGARFGLGKRRPAFPSAAAGRNIGQGEFRIEDGKFEIAKQKGPK